MQLKAVEFTEKVCSGCGKVSKRCIEAPTGRVSINCYHGSYADQGAYYICSSKCIAPALEKLQQRLTAILSEEEG